MKIAIKIVIFSLIIEIIKKILIRMLLRMSLETHRAVAACDMPSQTDALHHGRKVHDFQVSL